MPLRKLLAYGAIYILWSGSFLAIREMVAQGARHAALPPFFAAGFRFSVAGLALLLWSVGRDRTSLRARQALSAAALGVVIFTCEYAALFWAETRVASGIAAVVSAMIPVWIFAGELFVLRSQRATVVAVGGIAVGFAGVVVLALQPGRGGSAAPTSALAVLAMMAGALCWSAGTLLSRRLTLPASQKMNAGIQMLTGGLLLLVLSGWVGEWARLPPPAILLSARIVGSMLYLIVAASIVSYTAYVWLLTHDSPTRVSSYAYVNPVFALMIGAVLAGERLTPLQIVGAVLVVAGVFATLQAKSGRSSQRSAFEGEAAGRRR
jgi:drug/metabolite transporter (DMT)-like permease